MGACSTNIENLIRWIRKVMVVNNVRHPQIATLMGAWERMGRVGILMFSVACWDLGNLLEFPMMMWKSK